MQIRSIQWAEALPVRHQVLWPDKPPLFCKVDGDEDADHYGVYINDQLISVASIFIQNNTARLRKFATLPSHQGQGIGSKLISYLIRELKALHVAYFWCDARTSAVGFYSRFAMHKEGAEFTKSNVQYWKMGIQLNTR